MIHTISNISQSFNVIGCHITSDFLNWAVSHFGQVLNQHFKLAIELRHLDMFLLCIETPRVSCSLGMLCGWVPRGYAIKHRGCFRGFLPFKGHVGDIVGKSFGKLRETPETSNASHPEVNGLESEAGRTTV